MNLTFDYHYRELFLGQLPKTIEMLDYIFAKNEKAMAGITGYNIIDDITEMITSKKFDLIIRNYGEVFAKEVELYLAKPQHQQYEDCAIIRDLLKENQSIIKQKTLTL